ncbi:uncharacterized protein NECHADRAFT_87992 [Fusarium vanettenii 77-13-4]|uniref:Uncharacterized protein n=1 Tax=Fusarium vanettenii (strain ATCC MYA-4622 / CBS 123669 / FGSC 9596 / NRRL 45880 / 77-13-4) TaxID=660122 RepID=C7ZJZ8_FUSV7|nr:uncharacterized protein NECHADRAFT_87992 [Fusarium vanettenii 77-13-4]EEU35721.1 predicted protein [Fusarium vanettenii 77-13-4]
MNDSTGKGACVAEIVLAEPLTSDMGLCDVSHNVQTGWVANPLTSFHLANFCFHLAPDLPCHDAIIKALEDRSFGLHVSVSQSQAVWAVQVTLGANNEYEFLDNSLQDGFNIAQVQRGEAEVETICDTLEHLARFRMVKNLINEAPSTAFQEEFQIHMRQDDRSFGPGEQIEARNGSPLQVVIKNVGRTVNYAQIYDLGPCGRIKNISGGSYIPIPLKGDAKDIQTGKCTGVYTGKIKMK